jgi:hypothetical protein
MTPLYLTCISIGYGPYSLRAHLVISIFGDIELTYTPRSQPPILNLPQPRELMKEGRALQQDNIYITKTASEFLPNFSSFHHSYSTDTPSAFRKFRTTLTTSQYRPLVTR